MDAPRTADAVAPAGQTADDTARRYDVDLVRIIACVSVVVLHASGLLLPDAIRDRDGGAAHWIALTGDSLGRFAVPAFFAISGWAVLVASPPRSGSVLVRRVLRVVVPMATWTAVYLFANMLLQGAGAGATARLAVEAVFGSVRPAFHLWYLYSYVPLLILLGCVGLAIAGRPLRTAGWVLLVLAVLPTVAAPVALLTGLTLPKTQWTPAFYPIAFAVGGAALLARPPLRTPRWLVPAAAVVALLAVLGWQHAVRFPSPYGTPAVAAYTALAILLVMQIRVPERARVIVRRLADASFGVYLVHLLLLQVVLTWVVDPGPGGLLAGAALVAVSGAVVVASFGLSLLWGRLGWRRVLG